MAANCRVLGKDTSQHALTGLACSFASSWAIEVMLKCDVVGPSCSSTMAYPITFPGVSAQAEMRSIKISQHGTKGGRQVEGRPPKVSALTHKGHGIVVDGWALEFVIPIDHESFAHQCASCGRSPTLANLLIVLGGCSCRFGRSCSSTLDPPHPIVRSEQYNRGSVLCCTMHSFVSLTSSSRLEVREESFSCTSVLVHTNSTKMG